MPQYRSILITASSIGGSNTASFDLYSNADNYVLAFETNILSGWLLTGYTSNVVPEAATAIKIVSTSGACIC